MSADYRAVVYMTADKNFRMSSCRPAVKWASVKITLCLYIHIHESVDRLL